MPFKLRTVFSSLLLGIALVSSSATASIEIEANGLSILNTDSGTWQSFSFKELIAQYSNEQKPPPKFPWETIFSSLENFDLMRLSNKKRRQWASFKKNLFAGGEFYSEGQKALIEEMLEVLENRHVDRLREFIEKSKKKLDKKEVGDIDKSAQHKMAQIVRDFRLSYLNNISGRPLFDATFFRSAEWRELPNNALELDRYFESLSKLMLENHRDYGSVFARSLAGLRLIKDLCGSNKVADSQHLDLSVEQRWRYLQGYKNTCQYLFNSWKCFLSDANQPVDYGRSLFLTQMLKNVISVSQNGVDRSIGDTWIGKIFEADSNSNYEVLFSDLMLGLVLQIEFDNPYLPFVFLARTIDNKNFTNLTDNLSSPKILKKILEIFGSHSAQKQSYSDIWQWADKDGLGINRMIRSMVHVMFGEVKTNNQKNTIESVEGIHTNIGLYSHALHSSFYLETHSLRELPYAIRNVGEDITFDELIAHYTKPNRMIFFERQSHKQIDNLTFKFRENGKEWTSLQKTFWPKTASMIDIFTECLRTYEKKYSTSRDQQVAIYSRNFPGSEFRIRLIVDSKKRKILSCYPVL